jgi:sterol desaturase/sphingolipid hydroxylase (fatty acid hydroxylase superfamily)
VHRDLLHKRFWPLGVLYDRHTPQHHLLYVTDDMAIRDPREFRLVLVPAYGILAVFAVTVPPAAIIWSFGQANLAALFLAATMIYVVSYEMLHLSYHLPASSFVGSLRLVRFLREHHAIHHDPRLMQRWNFNVTIPLWDIVRGTRLTSRSVSSARATS